MILVIIFLDIHPFGVPGKVAPVKYMILAGIGKEAFLTNALLVVTYFGMLNSPDTDKYI